MRPGELSAPSAPLWGAGMASLLAANVGFGLLFAGMALRDRVPVYGSGRPTVAGWWCFGVYAALVGLLAIAAIAIGLWTMRRLRALDGPVQPYKYARIGAGVGVVVLLFGVLPIGRQLVEYLATLPPAVFELQGPDQVAALAAMSPAERAAIGRGVWRKLDLGTNPLPVLRRLVEDPDPAVRLEAARGVASRAQWDPATAPVLLQALQDPDQRVVRSAAYGAAWLDPRPPELIPVVETVLRNPPARGPGAGGAKVERECLEQLVHLIYLLGRRPAARNAMRRLANDPSVPAAARTQLRWRLQQRNIDPASPPEKEP